MDARICPLAFITQPQTLPSDHALTTCTSIKFFLPLPLLFMLLLSFLSSEDEYDEKCVSVMLEGEETEMVFIDHPHSEISVSGSKGVCAYDVCNEVERGLKKLSDFACIFFIKCE